MGLTYFLLPYFISYPQELGKRGNWGVQFISERSTTKNIVKHPPGIGR